jgi:hypothetical protein
MVFTEFNFCRIYIPKFSEIFQRSTAEHFWCSHDDDGDDIIIIIIIIIIIVVVVVHIIFF